MGYRDLASLLDDATSRFTTLTAGIHAEGRAARVVLTGGTAGIALLERLADDIGDLGVVESRPKQDGRNMTMVFGPARKGKK